MFKRLLEKLAKALDKAQLLYVIIGGQAVLLYGEPRLTKDIDITLGAAVDRLDVVLRVAKQVGLTPLVDPRPFVDQTMVLPFDSLKRVYPSAYASIGEQAQTRWRSP
ncbi:hypothetical protein [Rhodocaloribacter sp.]